MLFPGVAATWGCLWLVLAWGSPERLEHSIQPAEQPNAAARKPCPHAVGERWLLKENEVLLLRRGRGCRAGRRVDDQLPARFRAYSAPETSEWFPRRPGFQSGCDRDSAGSLASPLISAWQVVGCDHHLDSSKQDDKCLRCGGDGTTCYPVTGVLEANDLSRGGVLVGSADGSDRGLSPAPSWCLARWRGPEV